jgi:hypothetical protein
VRRGLGQHRQFQRHACGKQHVERSVGLIGGEQMVEREQAGEQGAEPQDRRADALEQREVGPERERHQRHHDEKEQHAHEGAAADAQGESDVTREQGGERGHAGPPSRNSRAPSRPIGPCTAATMMPPPDRCSCIR